MTKKPLSICIISSFITGFGKTGGFGNMTKQLALSLQERDCVVTVVVPKRRSQPGVLNIKGIRVIGLRPREFLDPRIFQHIDADIYHSQNPNFLSFVAMRAQPAKKHVVTCRDPMNFFDRLTEMRFASWARRLRSPFVFLFEGGPFVPYVVRKADLVGCPAFYLKEKIQKIYHRADAILLPNIERLPKRRLRKGKKASVLFVGRLDPRKRPEIVFDLAEKFREVDFLVVGETQEAKRQQTMLAIAARHPNIQMLGPIDKFASNRLSEIYEKSWILVNGSPREGLPLSFIEAAGHGCAILSKLNPDGFASRFGFWVRDGDFAKGLSKLLVSNRWEARGKLGRKYVADIYDEPKAVNVHLQAYENLLRGN